MQRMAFAFEKLVVYQKAVAFPLTTEVLPLY
jgi:hypothetical protein